MTRRDQMDQDLARALENEFATRVARGAQASGRGPSLPWQAVIAVAVAALVIGASIAALLVAVPRSAPATHSDTRHAGRFIGDVAFFDPIALDSTTLTLGSARYPLQGLPKSCGTTSAGADVHETSGAVTIVVRGYDDRPEPTSCGGAAQPALPVTVHLQRALGERALIDGTTGQHHVVLDPAIVPVPTALPTGFRGPGMVSWDEENGVAARTWSTGTTPKGSYVDYALSTSPKSKVLLGTNGKLVARISVHGHPAMVLVAAESSQWTAYVLWTAGDRSMRLKSDGTVRNHRTIAEIERVAESTPDP